MCLRVFVRSRSAAGEGGDVKTQTSGGQAERRAEGQSPGEHYHLERGGSGKTQKKPPHLLIKVSWRRGVFTLRENGQISDELGH